MYIHDTQRSDDIATMAGHCKDWMFNHSLPLWFESGWDPKGAFYEHLTLTGEPVTDIDCRVRVQARQTYCFALAAIMGWSVSKAKMRAMQGVDALEHLCERPDHLYGKMIRPDTGLIDDTVDLYDNAFVLLALATVYRAFYDEKALHLGSRLVQAINAHLVHPGARAGYCERLPVEKRRLQNPHMHLCEAFLAWFEATDDKASLKQARNIALFVEKRFFDHETAILHEKAGETGANWCEPGHMFEWTWLLARLANLSKQKPVNMLEGMYNGAVRLVESRRYIPVSQDLMGKPMDARQRTWIITEQIKAHIAMYRLHGEQALFDEIKASTSKLFTDHLDPAINGGWMDECDLRGAPVATTMTAATGYHVYLAFYELQRLAQDSAQARPLHTKSAAR